MDSSSELVKLWSRRGRMVEYLQLKMEEQDWHGVQDAGSDLREIDAMIKVLESKVE